MKNSKIKILGIILLGFLINSCSNELNTTPEIEDSLENLLRKDPNAIQGLVSRLYAGLSLTSNNGPGESDLEGPDKGETGFLRGILNLEDFSADCMKNRWGDDGLDQLTTTSEWNDVNKFFRYFYDRVYITVPNCNNIIKAINTTNINNKVQYISELRFIRSLAYFYMIDCFGKGILATENDLGSVNLKSESTRIEMFNYVEKELLEIELTIPQQNGYGRANKAVVQMLLAKLYLNAAVYTGTPRFNDAAIYTSKVIGGGYSLAPDFNSLFEADNNITLAKNEIIFPLICDSEVTQSYSNTTYLVNGSLFAATMTPADYGVKENGWGGHRATKALYKFYGNTAAAVEASTDVRASGLWTSGHSYEMNNYKTWSDGFPYAKFKNKKSIGNQPLTVFSSTDFPLYRLADAYLMYAECALRGASNANLGTALGYVNAIRTRSNATTISVSEMDLQFILDERSRELTMEGHRRTDLIRFGQFTGSTYLWPWKGNLKDGRGIPEHYKLYPIPKTARQANPNLTKTEGYPN